MFVFGIYICAFYLPDNGKMLRNCSCVTPCEQYLFEGSLSYAGLSVESVDHILDRDRDRLQQKFNRSINIGQRTGSTFKHNIRLAKKTHKMSAELLVFVRQYLNGPNSTVVELSKAVDVITDICKEDLAKLFQNLQRFKTVYELSYRNTIDLVHMQLDRLALTAMESSRVLLHRNDQGDIKKFHRSYSAVARAFDDAVWASKGLEEMHEKFHNNTKTAYDLLEQTNGELPNEITAAELPNFLPAKLYFNVECEVLDREITELLSTIFEIYETLEGANPADFEYILSRHDNSLSQNISEFLGKKRKFQQCLQAYEMTLKQSHDWITETTEDLSGKIGLVESIKTGLLNQTDQTLLIESICKATNKILKKYVNNSIPTEEFLLRFADFSQGQNIITVLRLFVERIKYLVIEHLTTEINNRKEDLSTKYKTALQKAGDLQIFVKPYYFYDFVSRMQIWEGPKPNINSPYQNSKKENGLRTIWNRDSNLSLLKFAKTQTSTAENLQVYMQSIKAHLETFEDQLISHVQSLIDTLEELESVHIELQNAKKINSVFVK